MKNQDPTMFPKWLLPMSAALLPMIVAGCTTPAHVFGGGTITLTPAGYDPKHYGDVTFKIEPAAAMLAGGAWNVQPGATNWFTTSQFVVPVVLNKPFIVTFKPVTGWQSPANQQINVKPNDHITNVVYYVVNSAVKP